MINVGIGDREIRDGQLTIHVHDMAYVRQYTRYILFLFYYYDSHFEITKREDINHFIISLLAGHE